MSPSNIDRDEQTEAEIGEVNAAGYARWKETRGEPLRLINVVEVILADAIMAWLFWVFWKPLSIMLGYATLVQAIVVVLVFVDVYLLRKNVRKQPESKKTNPEGSDGMEHNMY
jgi:hypothetical protein